MLVSLAHVGAPHEKRVPVAGTAAATARQSFIQPSSAAASMCSDSPGWSMRLGNGRCTHERSDLLHALRRRERGLGALLPAMRQSPPRSGGGRDTGETED